MSSTGTKGRDLIRWNMSSYSACRNIVLSQYSAFTPGVKMKIKKKIKVYDTFDFMDRMIE